MSSRPDFGHGPDDVEGPVAVEGSDLDGDDPFDFGEPPPEAIRQVRAADGLLKVEADERDHLGHGPAMGQPRVVVGAGTGEAEQAGVIAKVAQDPGLGDRLAGRTADSADPCQRLRPAGGGSIDLLGDQGQHRAIQAVPRVADGELGRVNTGGDAAGAGGHVISAEGPLPALVQPSRGRQGQRHRGNRPRRGERSRAHGEGLAEPSVITFVRQDRGNA